MNLRLHISKNVKVSDYSQWRYIRFVVVDLAKSKNYPANYVCLLPMQPSANGKVYNVFSELFGNDSLELAKRLLTEALKVEGDAEIKKEIEKRLNLLRPKLSVQIKCCVCGNFFEPERRRFKQKICQECTRKKYDS
jgi:hypothetical protein